MKTTDDRDDLETLIEEWAAADPEFPVLLAAAEERRTLMKRLREARRSAGLSRGVVAARMGTSESAVARLEGGELDARLSTVVRFAAALGQRLDLTDGRRASPVPHGR